MVTLQIALPATLAAGPTANFVPAGCYATVGESFPAALRASLREVIDDHTHDPYTSTATDTWPTRTPITR